MRALPDLAVALLALALTSLAGCAGASPKTAMTRAPVAASGAAAVAGGPGAGATNDPAASTLPEEKLVVTGAIAMAVEDGPTALAAIRASVEAAGGRVIHEQDTGRDHGWYGAMRVRLLPGKVADFVAALGAIGTVESKTIEATDVSRQYFDQELAISNLRVTLDRLAALLGNPDLTTANILEIEREMTRVRGEIERIEGEHRFLQDRVAYATFELTLHGTDVTTLGAVARINPTGRAAVLYVLDAAPGAEALRVGGGVTLRFPTGPSLDLLVFPRADGTSRAVIATMGGLTYSDFFGDGRRRWGNPYLGGQFGYGYLDGGSAFVAAGALGVELYKGERLTADLATRVHTFIDGDGARVALEASAGLAIPF